MMPPYFYKVTEELRRLGCEVKVYAEKDFVEQGVKGDIIFDMARDKVTIARLRSLEDEGAIGDKLCLRYR